MSPAALVVTVTPAALLWRLVLACTPLVNPITGSGFSQFGEEIHF
jgi:hypothetical protein